MTRTIVLERGEGASAEAVFLRDRFHLLAFLLPFVWLAARRLYLFAVLAFLVQLGLWQLGRVEGFGLAGAVLPILFGLAVALEGPRLVAWRLRRKGYREAGIVNAEDREEAELIYYGSAAAAPASERAEAEPAPSRANASQATAPSREPLPIFGWRSARTLLDTGERR